MICANCGQRDLDSDARTCPNCGDEPRLEERYVLKSVLGHRGAGTTYRATDGDREVVVKEMLLRNSEDMKEVQLFQREADVLAGLDAAGVPGHVEHFEVPRGKTVGLYNVHEYIEGTSLEEELSTGRLSTGEVLETVADVLEILAQLRTQEPPVVHRDIKPANLIRGADGETYLVDFGVARAVAESLHFAGSTVTGTFGYMAPEQLYGHAEPASDVYALGATGIRMLTGREPHELLNDDRRFDWREHAEVDADIADAFDAMTAWEAADRPADVGALAADLRARAAGDGALTRWKGRGQLTRKGASSSEPFDRPGLVPLVRELNHEPDFRRGTTVGLATATVGVGLILLGGAIPSLFMGLVFTIGYLFVVGLFAIVPAGFRSAFGRLLVYRRGDMVRGIVTDRSNDGERFKLAYRYAVDGETHSGEHNVSSDWYFEVEEGDEVEVYYDTKRPSRSGCYVNR